MGCCSAFTCSFQMMSSWSLCIFSGRLIDVLTLWQRWVLRMILILTSSKTVLWLLLIFWILIRPRLSPCVFPFCSFFFCFVGWGPSFVKKKKRNALFSQSLFILHLARKTCKPHQFYLYSLSFSLPYKWNTTFSFLFSRKYFGTVYLKKSRYHYLSSKLLK